jgi:hypothetical protein
MQLIVKEDKLQKYTDHIQTGVELTGKDKVLFDRYFFAFTQLLDGKSERQTVELLMNTPEPLGKLGQSQAYNVVNGAQEIFGKLDIGNSKKIAQRYIYATRLEEMALKLDNLAHSIIADNTEEYEDGHGNKITRIDPEIVKESGILIGKSADVQMKAARIRGLLEKDKVENPNKFKASPNIIFTDDLDALDLLREIEDGIYEDVTRNEGETEEDQATAAGE